MSVMARYVRAFPGDQQRAIRELDEHLDSLTAILGIVPTGVIDNPSVPAPSVTAPQAADFTVVGIDGKFLTTITNPQDIQPQSSGIMQLQIQAGINVGNLTLVHELQSATDTNFNQASGLTDYGIGPQLAYEIQDPNVTKFWRLRSSFDGQTWNDWQIFSSPATCGPVGVYSGLLRSVALALVNQACTPEGGNPCTQDGTTTNILLAASTWTAGAQVIKYNPGSVDPGGYGKFQIYTLDPKRAGGSVVYLTTTDSSLVTGSDGVIWFGTITTVAGGGGTGSGGGNGACLTGEVEWDTPGGGQLACQDMKLGDKVLSVDGGSDTVISIESIPNVPCFSLETADGKILRGASSTHLLKYNYGPFQKVFDLQVGDLMQVRGGSSLLTRKTFIGNRTVYKVGLDRTLVGCTDGFISHNMLSADKN